MVWYLVMVCGFALVFVCFFYTLMTYFLPKEYRLWNVPLFVFGKNCVFLILLNIQGIAVAPASLKILEYSTNLDPQVIIFCFLPPILFEAGLEIEWHAFKKLFWQSLLLAGPGF